MSTFIDLYVQGRGEDRCLFRLDPPTHLIDVGHLLRSLRDVKNITKGIDLTLDTGLLPIIDPLQGLLQLLPSRQLLFFTTANSMRLLMTSEWVLYIGQLDATAEYGTIEVSSCALTAPKSK